MVRVLLFVCLAVPLASCGHDENDEPTFRGGTAELLEDGAVRIREDSLPFLTVATVGDVSVTALVRAPARVAFRDGAVSEIGAPIDGRVTEVHVRVGQRVAPGDPVVTIASPSAASLRGDLARARVSVAAAEAELARQEAMRTAGVGVDVDRARAEADLAEARAIVSALGASTRSIGRGSAAQVVVRAPIAGTVLARSATVGASVSAGGDALVVLGEPSAVWVVAEVFEREVALVNEGATAHIDVATAGEIRGRVESVGGAVDPTTRRAPVYVVIDEHDGPSMRAGMYARVSIEIADAGLGIPASAVLVKDGGRTVVFVRRDERTFEARDVTVGAAVDGRLPVLAGLDPTDAIVTTGALLLDGQAELLR